MLSLLIMWRRWVEERSSRKEETISLFVTACFQIPRFICLYYLLDPIHRLHLFRPFLPSLFGEGSSDTLNSGELGEDDCSSTPSTPISLPPSAPGSDGYSSGPPVLSRAGFARRVEGAPTSPVACGTPHSAECKSQGPEGDESAPRGPIGDPAAAEGSFAQQAAAAEAAWISKRQQRGHRLGSCRGNPSSVELSNSDSTQQEIESLTSTQASSLLSLSLSSNALEVSTDSHATEAGGSSRIPSAAPSNPSPRSTQPFPASPLLEADTAGDLPVGRSRVFPCHSDSDWYNSVPAPFTDAGRVWGLRSCRLVLSKVPRSLRSMVRAWLKLQQWLQKAGLENAVEPWLRVVARLSDTQAFEPLMQSMLATKVRKRPLCLCLLFQYTSCLIFVVCH